MKAITTKYLPCTNTRGSRIKAMAEGVPSVIIGYDHAGDPHKAAAIELCKRMGWKGRLFEGRLPDGSGNVYVFANAEDVIV